MQIISRKDAAAQGLKRFFTGVPCLHGHLAERLVNDGGGCVECRRAKQKAYSDNNRDKLNELLRSWRRANPEKYKAIDKRKYEKSKAQRRAREKIWHEANRDRMNAYSAKWKKSNLDLVAADAAKRRSAKLLRSVPWADERGIKWYYEQAKRLEETFGVKFHVDHILPLQGDLVSGFHHQDNLQILTEEENLKKSNRFDPSEYQGAIA